MDSVCKNCDRDLTPEFAFCPGCGQKSNLHRLSWHDIVHEAIHYFTHADKGIFHLIRDLATKTGDVAKQYVDGRRKRIFPPLNFFLIIAAVLVISASWKQSDSAVDARTAYPELSNIADPDEREAKIAMKQRQLNVERFTSNYSNLMAMAALPISAFIFFVFYIRGRYHYIEHVVAGMFMIGFCILVYALILALNYLIGMPKMYASFLFLLFQIVYGAIFYSRFMADGSRKRRVLWPTLASFASVLVWIVLTTTLIGIYIRSGFWGLAH